MRVGDWDNAVTIGQELTTNTQYGYKIEPDCYRLFSVEGRANDEDLDKVNGGTLAIGAVPGKYSIIGQVGDKNPCDLVVYRYSDVTTLCMLKHWCVKTMQ